MKPRILLRIVLAAGVLLACAGVGWHFLSRLDRMEERRELNLYTLVPPDAVAVLKVHTPLLSDNRLDWWLGEYDSGWLSDFCRKMKDILVSYHVSQGVREQIVYCQFDELGRHSAQHSLSLLSPRSFPEKSLDYRGDSMRIYPLTDGRFLAVYVGEGFLVMSFQSRLIEKVMDARSTGHNIASLWNRAGLSDVPGGRGAVSLYLNADSVPMGKNEDSCAPYLHAGGWMEFDLDFRPEAFLCTGIGQERQSDSLSLWHALAGQHPVDTLDYGLLPSSVFAYAHWAFSDPDKLLRCMASHSWADSLSDDYMRRRDAEWAAFLDRYAAGDAFSCLFHAKDTAWHKPCAVIGIPLRDEWEARRHFRSWLRSTPPDKSANLTGERGNSARFALYPRARYYTQYRVPRTTLLTLLTGWECKDVLPRACFFRSMLLLAPDAHSLSAYIDALERKECLEPGILSPTDRRGQNCFFMAVGMGEVSQCPPSYVRQIPSFFLDSGIGDSRSVLFLELVKDSDGRLYPDVRLCRTDGD